MARKELYIQPVKAAKKWAKLGLETREKAPKSYKGGLDTVEAGAQGIGSGVARARDIVAGKKVNAYQVKAFFDRHRGFYQDAMAEFATQDKPLKEFALRQKSIQSWWLWGGEPLRKQVERAVAKDKKERKKKSNPPKTMPSFDVLQFLSFESYDLYKNVGYTDIFGQHTSIPDDMLEDFERADKMLQRAERINQFYDDRYILIKKADAILRQIHDEVLEIHRGRFKRDRKMPNPFREERFLYEGIPAALAEDRRPDIGEWWSEREMYRGHQMTPEEILDAREEIREEQKRKARRLREISRRYRKENPIDRPAQNDPRFDYIGQIDNAALYRHVLTGSQVYVFAVEGLLGDRLEAEVFDTTGSLLFEISPDEYELDINEYQDAFAEHADILAITDRELLEENPTPTDPLLYEQVKAEIKQRYEVWPSAYASGALVQEYKRRGGGYVNPRKPKHRKRRNVRVAGITQIIGG